MGDLLGSPRVAPLLFAGLLFLSLLFASFSIRPAFPFLPPPLPAIDRVGLEAEGY